MDENVVHLLQVPHHPKIFIIPFQAKESSKTRQTVHDWQDLLSDLGIKKQDAIVAVGGGITLDITGFLASTYLRGIDCYYIPTTLLAMTDAAFGGKTAVNTHHGKNLIGSFYLPKNTLIDPLFLRTLSPIDRLNGISEMIKYGILLDPQILDLLKVDPFDPEGIERSIRCKLEVVTKDLYDQNLRQVLNFGHTIGHAIEASTHYRIPHGLAVFFGMQLESGLIPSFQHHLRILKELEDHFSYPKISTLEIDWQLFVSSILKDKKSKSDKVPIVSSAFGDIKELEIETILSHIKKSL